MQGILRKEKQVSRSVRMQMAGILEIEVISVHHGTPRLFFFISLYAVSGTPENILSPGISKISSDAAETGLKQFFARCSLICLVW